MYTEKYSPEYLKLIEKKIKCKLKGVRLNKKSGRTGNVFKIPRWFFKELFNFKNAICFICKTQMVVSNINSNNQATIDRIDPKLNYTIDNIVLICKKCNDSKDSCSKKINKQIYELAGNLIITNQINNMFM